MSACLLALLFAFSFAAPALAAPEYQSSEPAEGASLGSAPAEVSITFSEPLDDSSTMSVENECGREVDSGIVIVEFNEMSVDITQGHYSGDYTVKYSASGVGGVTGTTNGSFSFNVSSGHPCGPDHDKNHEHGNENKEHEHGKKEHGHGGPGDHGAEHGNGEHVDHSTMAHSSTHTDHSAMGDDHTMHTDGKKHGEHSKHGSPSDEHGDQHGGRSGSFASSPLPELPADGRAALLALLLCAGLGVVGGVFLRSAG